MLVASGVPGYYPDTSVRPMLWAWIAGVCACLLLVNAVAVYFARHGWYQAFWRHRLVMASIAVTLAAALVARYMSDVAPHSADFATAPFVLLTLILPLVTAFFLLCGAVDVIEEVRLRRAHLPR